MVRQTLSLAEQFLVRSVAQFVKRRQIRCAVSVATSEVDQRVDALAIRRFDETAPRAGSVRQHCDDSSRDRVLISRTGFDLDDSPMTNNCGLGLDFGLDALAFSYL